MCLIVFGYKAHPDYNLIFAANRDENHSRPTRAAQFWDNYTHLLAGKDLKAGGTWMGINKLGAMAAITNYRNPADQKKNSPSRGHLVLDYLKNSGPPEKYLEKIDRNVDAYNGFSLILGNMKKLMFYSNQERTKKEIEPGIHGLSNHLLDTPWPKVKRAKEQLWQIIQNPEFSEDALFSLLEDERKPSEEELPDTGIPLHLEKKVSPIFIKSEDYGTRSSTVLLIHKNGKITFTEKRFKPGTKEMEDTDSYQFSLFK